MAGEKVIMGLDIGSSNVRAVIGSVSKDGQLMVDSICERPSEGVSSGAIVNIEQTIRTITSVISEAELQAGAEAKHVILGIGGSHIEGHPSQGVVGINAKDQEIKREDIFRSLDVARAFELPMDREILHTLVQDFMVDGRDGIKDPMDMLGHRLESRVLVVTGSSSICLNQRKCLQRAGYPVQRMVVQQLADAEIVLSNEEKEMGTILIDIGGGTTNMIVYVNGAPVYVGGVNLGGLNVTNDIAYILNKPRSIAEQVKIEYGCCHIPSVSDNEYCIIPQIGGMPSIRMPRKELSKIAEPRMAEIFSILQVELEKHQVQGSFGGGVVLVGGGALLSGATELASEIFRLPAHIGFPEALPGLDRSYINPGYSTVLGLLKTEAKKFKEFPSSTSSRGESKSGKGGGGFGKKFRSFFRTVF
ncbi:cell division protein FtsA [Parasphaerochaeta coccoides]|uniref:Cell division protein FtsA n=1 Tax=Parasphaerochaeta coccoides (strain ATCC BAA-1237 / DSM 17374 / SPN1) TaxID=760011 RepID=F4GKW4_PARC1|nr:cell division protein FtsA [Parasphaerochaeta coccoides]AEC01877.1 cell division protein FtsA [Parasphaerochaeta coccoides DSM 17374]